MSLHNDSIVMDGLVVSKWSEDVFRDMKKGGLTAANCTVSIWEDFLGTLDNIIDFKKLIDANSNLVTLVRNTDDVRRAKAEGKTGLIMGFQNSHCFEDRIEYVSVFKELGVGISQLTYNTQNLIGTGCYERDGGLSGYGHEIVAEMNRVGVLVDLSHVGPLTSDEAIRASSKPVCYSHCLPSGLKEHPRNKSDEQLKFIADRGGFVGVTMFPPFLKRGIEATLEDYVEAIQYTLNVVGEDAVGIGTDFTQGYDKGFFDWITHDKGSYRKLTNFGPIVNPLGIRTLGEYPNLTEAMQTAGMSDRVIQKVLGENWLRLLDEVWSV
ncbi:dipeptidase [Pseudomonas alloputida]|uniref:dipeptidase n=1 Tax=Pseudomonas TaxID=286 RepID=UPI003EEBF24B